MAQSLLHTQPSVFVTSTPLSLTASFLTLYCDIPSTLFPTLLTQRQSETSWDSPARKALGWAEKVAAALIDVGKDCAMNPARKRRRLVKNRNSLVNVIIEVRFVVAAGGTVAD
jgi:hypothetical protein